MTNIQERKATSPSDLPSDFQVGNHHGYLGMSIQRQVFVPLEPDKTRIVLQATYNNKT